MAALFHDVGKIDSVYSDILRKPDSLTDEEREVMESHVMKGVEFLRSMSSVPEEVITGVRSHHEREDGRGYPDRLLGPDIPLAAKVIKVCDSIDAMLSDRPYRRALTLTQVKSELDKYSGIEFDVRIAQSVLASSILEDHAREISGSDKVHARHYTPWKESAGYRSVPNRLLSLPLRSG
jgi:putative nucleotidyltransferase with HDIG domain